MWTPRRVVMLALGFIVYFGAYLAYARSFLGVIDGLPALPDKYMRQPGDSAVAVTGPKPPPPIEKKFIQAFGPGCEELKRPIRLEMHSRRTLLAADHFELTEDGRKLKLEPVSVALFGKDAGDPVHVEINTICCKKALLTLDQPIKNPTELNGRKITAAELIGDIRIVNNRKTPERTDDLSLYAGDGPVHYVEARQKIWTSASIHLVDRKTLPPTEVRGLGMEVTLATEPAPGKGGKTGKGGENITGVKQIVLQSTVEMHLYSDPNAPFPGGAASRAEAKPNGAIAADPAKKPAAKPDVELLPPHVPQKAHIIIMTPGRFVYDLYKDHDLATFSVPRSEKGGVAPEFVTVIRQNPPRDSNDQAGNIDQLVCEHLVVRLKRREEKDPKAPAAAAPAGKAGDGGVGENVDIEAVHATGRGRDSVTITSDGEHLEAHGNVLDYDARTHKTVLQGTPGMSATKEDANDRSVIQAPVLEIEEHPPVKPTDKAWQSAVARGAGRIDVFDKKTEKKKMQATWATRLTSTKDGAHDLLVLTGDARFEDLTEDQPQSLKAETLKVWLNPRDAQPAQPAQPARPGQQSARPHHVEAITAVEARSKELFVHNTAHLMIWFEDLPVGTVLPGAAPEPPFVGPPEPGAKAAPALTTPAAPPGATPAPAAAAPTAPPKGKEKDTPPRPIDLQARSVEVTVLRGGDKNVLKKLWSEGSVEVHQDPDPEKKDDKGVFIKGETLLMKNQLDLKPDPKSDSNNYSLTVRGDQEILAQLLMDKVFVTSTEINIDQSLNKAWCDDAGAMRLESTSTLGGDKTAKPTPLTIYWDSTMFFNGCYADFQGGSRGGVQAEQQTSHLAGQSLQVFFDRPISLKEGNKGQDPARVKNMIIDHKVVVEDYVFEPDDPKKLQKFTQLQAPWVSEEALEIDDDAPVEKGPDGKPRPRQPEGNEIRARGPGALKVVQKGGADPAAAPEGPPADKNKPDADKKKPPEDEMKMTYIVFDKSMYANTKTNTAVFLENVRVLNLPWDVTRDDPKRDIDLDTAMADLPKGAMYLRSDRLDVIDRTPKAKPGDPKAPPPSQKEMYARGRVLIQSPEYWGKADTVTFNEQKDQIILDGGEDGQAVLYKVTRVGEKPREIKGKKITYIRRTGAFQIDGGKWITGAGN